MNDLIEILKKPEQARALGVYEKHYPELAAIIRKAGPHNCRFLQDVGYWRDADCLVSGRTYILEPDYQSETEYVDYTLQVRNGCIYCEIGARSYTPAELTREWAFVCFYTVVDEHVHLEDVATLIRGGPKVFVRFVKE